MSEIVFNSPEFTPSLQTQIDSLQTTLASLNQQVIILQEAVQDRDQKITDLQAQLASQTWSGRLDEAKRQDNTLTIIGALINLYKFAFLPGKVS